MDGTAPLVKITITVEELGTGKTTTVTIPTATHVEFAVEDDYGSMDPFPNPVSYARTVLNRHMSLTGRIIEEYRIQVDDPAARVR